MSSTFKSLIFTLFMIGSIHALPEPPNNAMAVLIPKSSFSKLPPDAKLPNSLSSQYAAKSSFNGSFAVFETVDSNDEESFKKLFGSDIVIDKNTKIEADNRWKGSIFHGPIDSTWAIRRISGDESPNDIRQPDNEGKNVTVFVLDSGIKVEDSEFNGRASHGAAFADENVFEDKMNHGTGLAGLVASNKFGIARKSNVVNVRVLDEKGFGTAVTLTKGINYVIEKKMANASLHAIILIASNGDRNKVIDKAVEEAKAKGIVVVVSAGDYNADASTKSPAGCPHAFTVGAVDANGAMTKHSNWGSPVDIFAPGQNLHTLKNDGKEKRTGGTSGAAALAAGVAALVMGEKPEWTDEQVLGYIKKVAYHDTKVRFNKPNTITEFLRSGVTDECEENKRYCLAKV